jgi:hypothetical protein
MDTREVNGSRSYGRWLTAVGAAGVYKIYVAVFKL